MSLLFLLRWLQKRMYLRQDFSTFFVLDISLFNLADYEIDFIFLLLRLRRNCISDIFFLGLFFIDHLITSRGAKFQLDNVNEVKRVGRK